jgi:cytosine/adenosine deaminase-related metal-dependent hydrolase
MLLRSRIVLPVSQPAIENGALAVSKDRVTAVGRWRDLSARGGPVIDLGDVILLPGLVNAHCHLDYTGMARGIPAPGSFPDWIKALLSFKAHWSYSEYARSWLDGADMLLRTGTTTVADIEAVPELLPEAWASTPLRVHSFLEMTGVKSRRPPGEIVGDAERKIASLTLGSNAAGLSPHAPYSTSPDLLRCAAESARRNSWRITTHVAESAPEFEMFIHRRGSLFDWLKDQRDTGDCGIGSPVRHLERHGLLADNFLGVHVNYLAEGDARLLGESGAHVVHCPRSHAYFGHHPFPRRELAGAGVNLCLGTDSLASTGCRRGEKLELDMFAEMRAFAAVSSDLPPEQIVRMATVNGARALGLAGQAGELSEGSFADCIAIPFRGSVAEVWEAVLRHSGDVAASMINGRWALAHNR